MTVHKITPGKYLNSPPYVIPMSCPGGNFQNFAHAYADELRSVSDKVVDITIRAHEMIVEFSYGTRIYKEIPE